MSHHSDAERARQGEFGRRTFVVLVISTAAAVILAIGAYTYVFTEDNSQLDGPVPSTPTVQTSPDTAQ